MVLGNANIIKMQTISGAKRNIVGKKVRTLRAEGLLPAVMYGEGKEAEHISIKQNEFKKLWETVGESTILELDVEGKKTNVLIHEIAFDPVRDFPIHVDFLAVDMSKPIKVDVRLEFVGEETCEAVKIGGIIVKVMHELHIEALPKDLPHEITIDCVTLKKVGDAIAVRDAVAPTGVTILNRPEDSIVLVAEPRAEETEEAEAPSLEDIEVVGKKEKEDEEGEERKEEEEKSEKKEEKNKK